MKLQVLNSASYVVRWLSCEYYLFRYWLTCSTDFWIPADRQTTLLPSEILNTLIPHWKIKSYRNIKIHYHTNSMSFQVLISENIHNSLLFLIHEVDFPNIFNGFLEKVFKFSICIFPEFHLCSFVGAPINIRIQYLYEHLWQDLQSGRNDILSREANGHHILCTISWCLIVLHQVNTEYRVLHTQEVVWDQLYW